MLKSNITNLQFILDNKPQYSISFDKQQEKYMFLGILVFRFGFGFYVIPNRKTEIRETCFFLLFIKTDGVLWFIIKNEL